MTVRACGWSLWLLPAPPERAVLEGAIRALAARFGMPAFPPHVTLLGGIEGVDEPVLRERARVLAGELAPLELALGPFGHEVVPTRWLFLYAERAPPLRAAHRRALALHPERAPRPFTPHLSLLYGEPDPEAARAAAEALDLPPRVRLAELALVRTDGPVEAWEEDLRLPLRGTSP